MESETEIRKAKLSHRFRNALECNHCFACAHQYVNIDIIIPLTNQCFYFRFSSFFSVFNHSQHDDYIEIDSKISGDEFIGAF